MRRTLGTAVFSGMLGVTIFGVILTPVFYYVVDRLAGTAPSTPAETAHASTGPPVDGQQISGPATAIKELHPPPQG
jgi:hypothetical protein